jgi:hypothetical protein
MTISIIVFIPISLIFQYSFKDSLAFIAAGWAVLSFIFLTIIIPIFSGGWAIQEQFQSIASIKNLFDLGQHVGSEHAAKLYIDIIKNNSQNPSLSNKGHCYLNQNEHNMSIQFDGLSGLPINLILPVLELKLAILSEHGLGIYNEGQRIFGKLTVTSSNTWHIDTWEKADAVIELPDEMLKSGILIG